jgi:hypothetical protein
MLWLGSHPQIEVPPHEVRWFRRGEPVQMIYQLHNLSSNCEIIKGYKAPNEISNVQSLWFLNQYFPRAKLFVGLRHPGACFLSL